MAWSDFIPLIGAGINAATQIGKGKKGRTFVGAENQKNKDFAVDMWNKENEYNLPVNQMQRLKDAGINPHLAYSQGAIFNQGGSVPNAPSHPLPQYEPFDSQPLVSSALSVADLQIKEAQKRNIDADTENKLDQNVGIVLMNDKTAKEISYMDDQNLADLNLKTINARESQSRISVNEAEVDKKKQEITNLISTDEKIQEEIKNFIANRKLTEQQVANLIQMAAVLKAQEASYYASAEASQASAEYSRELAKNQGAVRSNLYKTGEILTEEVRKRNRENFIGERWDFSDRENKHNMDLRKFEAQKTINKGLILNNVSKELGISRQEADNFFNIVNGTTNSILNVGGMKGKTTTKGNRETTMHKDGSTSTHWNQTTSRR